VDIPNRNSATGSNLVNGFRPLTDQSLQTQFANLFKEVLRVVSQSWGTSSTRAEIYSSVLYAMLTCPLVTDY
jgi:hypothetical protein